MKVSMIEVFILSQSGSYRSNYIIPQAIVVEQQINKHRVFRESICQRQSSIGLSRFDTGNRIELSYYCC